MKSFSFGHQNIILLSLSAALAVACGQSSGRDGTKQVAPGIDLGNGGGGQGGQSSAPSATGSACAADDQCNDGVCLTEAEIGWPAGYCSGDCEESCAGGGVCINGSCLVACDDASDCRDAYDCVQANETAKACVPACTSDAQCAVTGVCDEDRGLCALAPESTCDDFRDNDGDKLTDCEDDSCQGTAACQPGTTDVGLPCTASSECKATGGDPVCLSEAHLGWPKGSCSEFCTLGEDGGCSGDGVCLEMELPSGGGVCFDACNTGADCPTAGYVCEESDPGIKICKPRCTVDAECDGFCNDDKLLCSAVDEDCGNGVDDDDDREVDCQDRDCAATCASDLQNACSGASPSLPSNQGDTTNGTHLFGGSCTGDGGAEQIFTFTPGNPGETGTLSITLNAAADMGFYVRRMCADQATEIGCSDHQPAGTEETMMMTVEGGQPLSIFVDGVGAADVGPFDLEVSFTTAECGDGNLVAPEECDDGNTTSGDGCDSTCKVESGSVCGSALDAQATNNGDTTGGTSAFQATCTGENGAKEEIYTFTPPSDGTLELVLSSATDQGLYVRTNCSDADTEIACADFNAGGDEESISLPVSGGVPLFIFIDGYGSVTEAGPYTLTVTFTP